VYKFVFEQWSGRMRAVGRAQGRYLFLLAVTGVFYYALEARLFSSTTGDVQPLELPFVR